MDPEALALLRLGVAIPACPLALNARRQLDERRQRALIRYYTAAGAGGVATGGSAGVGLDASADAPIDYGPYPAGPYGNAVGDTIANLAWQGHVNLSAAVSSDTLPSSDYSTDDMRKSGKSYGLIHLSAFT